jgi:CheY-like chemotaxis protein
MRSRIFEPFFTTKFAGRGLGLAAAVGIVRSHRGLLALRSESGQGTEITVVLPMTEAAYVARDVAAPSAAELSKQGAGLRPLAGTILVVDDQEEVREVAQRILESAGLKVLLARDGSEAHRVFVAHANTIDAVVLDLTMPGLSGSATLATLRSVRPNVRVLVSSGFDANQAVLSSPELSACQFLKKPYGPRELLGALSDVLSA